MELDMAEDLKSVVVERTALGVYQIRNVRGGAITLYVNDTDFTAVELLLGAIGACTINDVDHLTSRRAEPESLSVEVSGNKTTDEGGNIMRDVTVTFRAAFPEGPEGDAARAALPRAVAASHDRLCTVSRTVQTATPVTTVIAPD